MNCITAKNHLSAYCDGELSAQLASQVRDHIAGCTDCSDELASFNKLSAMFAASSVPEPPATLWSNIESAMTTSPEKQRVTINRPVGVSPRVLRLALAASLLLVLGIWRTSVWQSNDHRQHDELAVNLRELMSEFSSEPLLAMNKLSEQYRGVEVSLDGAENLLGYRPAIGKNLPSGYQLTSTRVLKMPCCTCSASICTRTDGTSFVVFEHETEQQMWFGDAPAISAKCGGKECRLVQMPEQMAVTWKSGKRQLTAIGVNGVEEVANLVAAVDGPTSAG